MRFGNRRYPFAQYGKIKPGHFNPLGKPLKPFVHPVDIKRLSKKFFKWIVC
jgi:hypothetical protein